jgi:putative SOS response-associated peptidase YedK
MCGPRASLHGFQRDQDRVPHPARAADAELRPNLEPRADGSDTDRARDRDDGQRRLEVVRWALIRYWAKDIKIAYSTINARCKDIGTKPAFREA